MDRADWAQTLPDLMTHLLSALSLDPAPAPFPKIMASFLPPFFHVMAIWLQATASRPDRKENS